MWKLETPITELKTVGSAYKKRLEKLGIKTVKDLLWHFPTRYEDFSHYLKINRIKPGLKTWTIGKLTHIENRHIWKSRLAITTAKIEDETGFIKAVWYNQPFLIKSLFIGSTLSLSGNVKIDKYGLYLQNPSYEIIQSPSSALQRSISSLKHTGGLIPIYPETHGLTSRYLRFLIKPLLNKLGYIAEWLPNQITKKYDLPSIKKALLSIHFPNSQREANQARKRFAFEELILFQLRALKERKRLNLAKAHNIPFNKELIKKFVEKLPFQLTNAQRLSLWEIIQDAGKPHPMNRLLNGDVGSGKTIVAAAIALEVAKAGYQVAYMAPTEILSHQHLTTFISLLKDFGINLALITGPTVKISEDGLEYEVKKQKLSEKLVKGEIDIVIGTHALIQAHVQFKNLALVIIDEQHRFGVRQRAELLKKGQENHHPHLLSMTATPIPRTLALTLYGDLDISILNEMPKGRQRVKTELIQNTQRKKAYEFIRNHVNIGRQVFVICPKIGLEKNAKSLETKDYSKIDLPKQMSLKESDLLEKKAVLSEYEKLSKEVFPNLRIAMLHGKMKPKEKEQAMNDFKTKKYDILVATSVIEVGVDIPNATIMAIEGAEYFGLAQLHQFRGRVGRGEHQSHCLLFIESPLVATTKRLEALVKNSDGFKLAEMDLKIRGPGEFLGSGQSGMPDLVMSSLTDIQLIKIARDEATQIIKNGIDKYTAIEKRLKEFNKEVHLE